MTETQKTLVKYLDKEDLELIHKILLETYEGSEPIPPFSSADESDVDSLIKISKTNFFGIEQYPTLVSKAAIIFFTVNKKHLFLNANKRMSVLCLLIFLAINKKRFVANPDELTDKALWLAKTTHEHNFGEIKKELENWITQSIEDIK